MKTAKQILDEMKRIENIKSLASEFDSDARYTWPDRWSMLRMFVGSFCKFQNTFCSQCGEEFGPGDSGYSHCQDHNKPFKSDAHKRTSDYI